jgi:hypothetical protein
VTAIAQTDTTKKGNASVAIQAPTLPGTYPITVTVTGGATHPTQFNLIVQ